MLVQELLKNGSSHLVLVLAAGLHRHSEMAKRDASFEELCMSSAPPGVPGAPHVPVLHVAHVPHFLAPDTTMLDLSDNSIGKRLKVQNIHPAKNENKSLGRDFSRTVFVYIRINTFIEK